MQAFVFPGQGSQYPGMGKELAAQFAVARQTFEEASDALGLDMMALCFDGSEDDLKLTSNTQPAILTVSVAAWRVLAETAGWQPAYVAGHSLGEYSALVCAGAFDFADAVSTVRQRGQFMQGAVPVGLGGMAAVMGLDAEELAEVCRQAAQGQVCAPANFNSPGQIVIAGHAEAVQRACDLAKSRGAKRALPLPVSAPFHCQLMQPAAEQLATVLERVCIHPLKAPVVSNVEAVANQDPERVSSLLVTQVCAPVRWDASVRWMAEQGVQRFVEIGPGKVLSGLVKRIIKGAEISNVEDPASLKLVAG